MAVSSPLRVLHVYSGNLYGGIETFLRALAEERDNRNIWSTCGLKSQRFAYEGIGIRSS